MPKALRNMGPRKLELFEMEGVIASALELDEIDRWTMNATFDKFPRLAVYLPLVPLSVGKVLYMHRRLMIALDPDDKKTLEQKNNILIKTSNSDYVISWKENEQEKKTGEAGKKEEAKKKKKRDEKVEEAKEQKVADTKDTKDTKEPKMDDEASDGKNKMGGAKTGEKEEVKKEKMTGGEVKKKEDEDGEKMKKDERRKKEKNERKYVDDKKTFTVIRKKKNQERKEGQVKMGRGSGYTKEEDQKIISYAYQKIKHSFDFGYKCSKLASAKDWEELASEMVDKNGESLEQRFRRHLKGKLYGFDNVNPEKILVIAKQLEVGMSEATQKALEEHSGMSIQLNSEMKIVNWCKNTTSN